MNQIGTFTTRKGKEQLCGQLAKQALERLVRGQDVICKGDKRDRYKRLITGDALRVFKGSLSDHLPVIATLE